ncbi:MAG TPA: hypothetical protein PLF81_06015 [Candidatus Anammoximicrobium sp.]|nr:hypothetical protein [Candidatus Anammoximicrobium sp.]
MSIVGLCEIAALLAMQVGVGQLGSPPWVRVVDKASFSPRDTAEGVVFDGRMWLSNGYVAGGKLVRDLWSSRDAVTWELVSDNTPYDGYSEMVVYQGKIWAVKASVWNSSDGLTWTQVSAKTENTQMVRVEEKHRKLPH